MGMVEFIVVFFAGLSVGFTIGWGGFAYIFMKRGKE